METDYMKYRGKCKELCLQAIESDPTLTLVRGHYFCPIWNREDQHWWTVRPDGTIHDPSARQFPSKGNGIYTEFTGVAPCSNCGEPVKENEAYGIEGRYIFCSGKCYGQFVGVY